MNFIKNELKVIKEKINSSTLFGMSLNNALGSLTVRVVSVLLVFLTNVALARTLGTTEYGIFVYATSWLNIFLVIAMFGFDKLMVRQVAIYQSHQDWGRLLGIYQYAKKCTFSSSIIFGLILCTI
ncbi:MAG TPA: oligosaccharide flippase family protein, partial [Anaerolineales bacterium]|nr:oligosaccharide flippase family protein [Anaerolineales bacterium]